MAPQLHKLHMLICVGTCESSVHMLCKQTSPERLQIMADVRMLCHIPACLLLVLCARVSQGEIDLSSSSNHDTDLSTPGWIVTGPNVSADGVPSCSYCLQVFTEGTTEFRETTDSDDFSGMPAFVGRCRSFENRELWQYSNTSGHLVVTDKTDQTLCLEYAEQEDGSSILIVDHCNGSPKQKWYFESDSRIRSGLTTKVEEEEHLPQYLAQTDPRAFLDLFLLTAAAISDPANHVQTDQFTFQFPASYWADPGLSLRRDSKNTVPPNSTQNLMQNGGFERSTIAPGWPAGNDCSASRLPPFCTSAIFTAGEYFSLCSWIVISPPEWISGRAKWAPARGNSSLLLSNQAVINQTLPTVPNLHYVLSFNLAGYLSHSPSEDDYSACPNSTVSGPDVKVHVYGPESTAIFNVTQFSTDGHLRWLNRTMNFTAVTNITVVEFSSLRTDDCAALIDEVKVAP